MSLKVLPSGSTGGLVISWASDETAESRSLSHEVGTTEVLEAPTEVGGSGPRSLLLVRKHAGRGRLQPLLLKWQARGIAMRPAQKNGAKCAHKPRSRATAVGLRIRLLDLRLVALACGIGRQESGLAWPHAPKKARFT